MADRPRDLTERMSNRREANTSLSITLPIDAARAKALNFSIKIRRTVTRPSSINGANHQTARSNSRRGVFGQPTNTTESESRS